MANVSHNTDLGWLLFRYWYSTVVETIKWIQFPDAETYGELGGALMMDVPFL